MTKSISILLIGILLLACTDKMNKDIPADKNTEYRLWEDKTETYLPITREWTNRVEVADINGDKMIDLLFANGGNYSSPGEPEFSRIFVNQGADKKFKEVTDQVFSDSKFLSRVIKVRDINSDSIPDIILGTTYQTQSQLYVGLGNGKFKNVTSTQLPQINGSVGDIELGDVDDDGDLDMVLSDWGAGSNMNNSGGRTMLWVNDGKGYFTDLTQTQMPEILIQFSWDLEFLILTMILI
ncbi:FG-GAP-like repeat-containing protein [Maribacter halichondriae]|uniref:FG-GAP-like repeat-containing protein n=1 Tax=Maribacter halichondriae TaxID=2980554 RepID=UPI00235834D4|nr:FG-GAP-like repeat-containing protein [Maribacter sp. Hal144]